MSTLFARPDAVTGALQRFHARHLLAVRVFNVQGRLLQVVLHDAKEESTVFH